ncbi:hypothetical protein BH11VER1_BH11VER1_28330 [soil metagenome]
MNQPSLSRALEERFKPLFEAERQLWRRKVQVAGFLIAAFLIPVLAWILWKNGSSYLILWLAALALAPLVLLISSLMAANRQMDLRQQARRIENEHPELQAALLTALDQSSGSVPLTYLQERVVHEALAHGMKHDWFSQSRRRSLTLWSVAAFAMMIVYAASFLVSQRKLSQVARQSPALNPKMKTTPGVVSVDVKPGDTEVEQGGRLIVEARFTGGTPAKVEVHVSDTAEMMTERARESMKPAVEAGHYGGLIKNVGRDGFYQVIYDGQTSPVYRITTYVHPELVSSDVTITPPAYTGQPVKEIKNTQNVSVLEGSTIKFDVKINKPITAAELFGEDKSIVPLSPRQDNPLLLEGSTVPEKTQKYRLHLVDAKERSSKQAASFSVQVLKDQPPKIEVVFPKRDLAVSPIQEMPLEAKVWDDQGVKRSGAVFTLAGKTHEVIFNEAPLKGGQSHALKTLLELEKLKAEPTQLLSYFVWAEDASAEGKVRRTQSDLFFAEVRHFEDIFREGEAPPGEEGEAENSMQKLIELQKQVVNANWRIMRDSNGGKTFDQLTPDVGVVNDSEGIALIQTDAALKKVNDAEMKAALLDASKGMKIAVTILTKGLEMKTPIAIEDALTPEREALEALYRAQTREHLVVRSKPSKSSSASKKASDQQVMELELKQKEQRYEEEKAATEEKTAEQQENLQVLNRLKELARRQEALAEKIKEVESQLQKAKTEEQKKELAQQLKSLQEEQQQLLRDLDELKARMEKPENQSQMAQEKEKLDEAREQARQAAEQLAENKTSAAANAATRAQKSLEEVRDDFRERTAKQFANEMKKLKQDAAALTENEEKIAQAMTSNAAANEAGKGGSDLEKSIETAKQERGIQTQREDLEKLLEQMRQLSEQSESAEPLLSNALHEAVRAAHSDGVDKALAEAQENARFGSSKDAQSAERKAAAGMDKLQQGVEKAAESVLGSETEALRMARAELDRLLMDAGQEKPGDGKSPGDPLAASGKAPETKKDGQQANADSAKADAKGAEGQPGEQGPSSQAKGEQASADDEKGKGKADGKQPGEAGKEGNEPGKGAASTPQGKGEQANAGDEKGKGMAEGKQPGEAGKEGAEAGKGEAGTPQGKGEQASAGASKEGSGTAPSPQGEGKGTSPGSPAGRGSQPSPGTSGKGAVAQGGNSGGSGGGANNQGGLGDNKGLFFEQVTESKSENPVTGENYGEWTDRLRKVEEALNAPELRNQASRVLDNAREMRTDFRRNNQAPQSAQLQTKITEPLAELRNRVAEELAKREATNPLAPLDRDPVPQRYREMVRRYYQELGAGD